MFTKIIITGLLGAVSLPATIWPEHINSSSFLKEAAPFSSSQQIGEAVAAGLELLAQHQVLANTDSTLKITFENKCNLIGKEEKCISLSIFYRSPPRSLEEDHETVEIGLSSKAVKLEQ